MPSEQDKRFAKAALWSAARQTIADSIDGKKLQQSIASDCYEAGKREAKAAWSTDEMIDAARKGERAKTVESCAKVADKYSPQVGQAIRLAMKE